MKRNRLYILSAAFLLALLPVMILRDFTPSNELRYLSIADEALRDGHLFAFTNQGEPYADKPPLYLWIIMLGKVLFGEHRMWFLALFSFLPALGILCIMDRWTRQALDERNRTTAALMLMTCGLYLGLAVFLRMDMLMCLFITLALYSFWQIQSGGENLPTHRILFPVWILLAIFTKGPIGMLVPLVSTVAFLAVKHRRHDIARCWGWRSWTIIGGGCVLWFAEVWLEGGPEYLNNLLFHQTFDRAVDAFHHKEPVWYYLVSIWYSLAPWSPLIVFIIGMALLKRIRLSDLEQFFLTVILTTLVMLSVFSSKIAVYLAPAFPFFVYLTVMIAARTPTTRWMKATVALPALLWIAAPAAILVLARQPEFAVLHNGWCVAAATLLGLTGLATMICLHRDSSLHRSIALLASGTILASGVGGFALPQLNVELGYGSLCREVIRLSSPEAVPTVYTWGIRRPESMDVYLGEDVREVTTEEVIQGQCTDGVLLLPARMAEENPDVRHFIAGHTCHRVGKFLIVELKPHKQAVAALNPRYQPRTILEQASSSRLISRPSRLFSTALLRT